MDGIRRRGFIKGAAAGGIALASGAGALLQGALTPDAAFAQGASDATWPNKPVRFVVPLAPGGAIDFVARAVGAVMSQSIGQQVIVENRTGAGGTIGMNEALKSAPDGYTVLITNDNAASAPHIMNLATDYTKELTPLIGLARQPQVLGVHPSVGASTLAEFVAYVKAHPGLGFGTSGVGSNQHVIGEWFKKMADLKLDHVPYRGAGQAVNDLLAGHVKCAFLGPTALIQHYKAGNLRLLAQSSAARAPTLQEIPTLEEAGYKGLVLEAWYAAFAPPATPPALVARLNAEMQKALGDATLRENFTKGSLEAVGGSPEQLATLARADSAKYARLVKELNIHTN
jgi:tripartite-type tricarboxylate transporter receptor subunit TctC